VVFVGLGRGRVVCVGLGTARCAGGLVDALVLGARPGDVATGGAAVVGAAPVVTSAGGCGEVPALVFGSGRVEPHRAVPLQQPRITTRTVKAILLLLDIRRLRAGAGIGTVGGSSPDGPGV
jgi:hypothetical protein